MALGFTDFSAGQQLTADIMDGLLRQTIMTFASEAARDSALAGVLAEGMFTYQSDTNTLTFYTGAAWRIVSRPPTAYTPTLGGAGWSLGVGGTAFGKYSVASGWVSFGATITFAGASSFGASQPTISLPLAAITDPLVGVGSRSLIDCELFDASGLSYRARAYIGTSITVLPLAAVASGSYVTDTNVSSTVPFTWATGDIIYVAGSYEMA